MALACGSLPLYINTYMLTREVIVSVANLYMQGLQAFSNFDRQISCYLFACLRYGAQQLLLQQCGCTGRHGRHAPQHCSICGRLSGYQLHLHPVGSNTILVPLSVVSRKASLSQ